MTDKRTNTSKDCNESAPGATFVSISRFISEHPGWETVDEHGAEKLRKQYSFGVFDAAIHFAEQLIYLAREAGHHPVIRLERNTMRVFVTWWTKEMNGIHNQDLMLAAQTDRLFDAGRTPEWSTGLHFALDSPESHR